ncbi:hypothetical protein [Streptomyces naphthomycinicus]|uniref:hypothetical protein n=1 Tax=Streptomyces naphthomycinicus TaxID=2872625 RepID=UPI001CED03A4|nr:hypothetical protein [Streptomyces sp. TML10]
MTAPLAVPAVTTLFTPLAVPGVATLFTPLAVPAVATPLTLLTPAVRVLRDRRSEGPAHTV